MLISRVHIVSRVPVSSGFAARRVALLCGLNLAVMAVALFGLAFLPAPTAMSGARSVIVIPGPFGPDAATIVAQAQGVFVRVGHFGAMLARGDAPDFVARLYARGALMVLDGKALEGCGSPRFDIAPDWRSEGEK